MGCSSSKPGTSGDIVSRDTSALGAVPKTNNKADQAKYRNETRAGGTTVAGKRDEHTVLKQSLILKRKETSMEGRHNQVQLFASRSCFANQSAVVHQNVKQATRLCRLVLQERKSDFSSSDALTTDLECFAFIIQSTLFSTVCHLACTISTGCISFITQRALFSTVIILLVQLTRGVFLVSHKELYLVLLSSYLYNKIEVYCFYYPKYSI